jgi:hypothetical protein
LGVWANNKLICFSNNFSLGTWATLKLLLSAVRVIISGSSFIVTFTGLSGILPYRLITHVFRDRQTTRPYLAIVYYRIYRPDGV